MTHRLEVCEYGQVHAQCRCPSPVKTVIHVSCDVSQHQRAYEAEMARRTYLVQWRCTGCEVTWYAPRNPREEDWYERIDCVCPPTGVQRFEVVEIQSQVSGQRTLL